MDAQQNKQIDKLTDEVISLRGNINAMSVRAEALHDKIESLEQSIKDLLEIQNAFIGTKTFVGWITQTVKYFSIVVGGISASIYFIGELLHKVAK